MSGSKGGFATTKTSFHCSSHQMWQFSWQNQSYVSPMHEWKYKDTKTPEAQIVKAILQFYQFYSRDVSEQPSALFLKKRVAIWEFYSNYHLTVSFAWGGIFFGLPGWGKWVRMAVPLPSSTSNPPTNWLTTKACWFFSIHSLKPASTKESRREIITYSSA